VVWIYAALAEIAMHTVFMGTFGADYTIVVFHAATVTGFTGLAFVARRAATQ
jgi:hypothetical protein